MVRWGIDLGGTKTEIIGLDAHGETLLRHRVATPKRSYDAIVRGIVDLVKSAEAQVGEQGTIGIGTPGSISTHTGLLRNSNTVVLNGKPLHRDLEGAFRRDIKLANDANCFALSEAVDGAGAGHDVVFGVILGTGCGGGIVVRGELLGRGANGLGGEWGHNPLPWPGQAELPGPVCYCGKRGCIETWISATALAAEYERVTGERETAPNIVAMATRMEPEALAVLQHYEERVARCLASMINVLDPDVIVLGGGASNISTLYSRVPDILPRWVFADRVDTPIVKAKHGDSSGVRGAAWLWGRGESAAAAT